MRIGDEDPRAGDARRAGCGRSEAREECIDGFGELATAGGICVGVVEIGLKVQWGR